MATQVTDYRLEINESRFRAESYFPGITYDDFDRAGGISPWKICRMFEAGRNVPFYQGNFLELQDLRSENFGFYVLGGDYYFDPCVWEVARKYQYFPYKISIELINQGETSLTFREILINTLDGKEIATFYGKLVYVDKSAKRSQVLPYWHRMKYRSVESPDRVRIDFTLSQVPSDACRVKTLVSASDVDHNGHTNQASYVRFCMDAAESVNRRKQLKRFSGDICLYPIMKLSTAYRSETYVGDELSTCLWQDDLSPFMIHFVLFREDTIVFSATVTFKNAPCSKL
ncbi:uncharacterized protein LOC101860848 [Aplysia californica]|uniref:Uncharacterized protein LOC101860848 n=1 Tax=Aplysia californica TaxID=6500 RepID=A0ABM0K5B4_APLCA|nr:uncharacterized protein LOC101860848 [Aplysia californica]